jgi:hypothetical protein
LKPTKIFLDLDDVLNDFTMHTLRKLGCGIDKYDPEWGWDIVTAANSSHPLRHFTPESFWSSFGREHWATVPKSGMCDWLIDTAAGLVGQENVFILTCPTRDPASLSGKLEWIYSNLPTWLHRQYVMSPRKFLCASPTSLLIDDRDDNVDRFCEEGGRAILVPRPWNNRAVWSDRSIHAVRLELSVTF